MLKASLAMCGIALVIEALLGYSDRLLARIGHPVIWMGAAIAWLDRTWNAETAPPSIRRRNGFLGVIALVILTSLVGFGIQASAFAVLPAVLAIAILAILASTGLAQRSLGAHVQAVADALERGGLGQGRCAVGRIVGRDTSALDEAGVARAAIESLSENFSDGVVAPSLYLALFGLPGILAYKAINTADSMIGHRTPRHAAFGFAAAKIDDVVNWPAARLAAVLISLAAALTRDASAREARRVVRRDARGHASPNAGWPEAAMAGALRICLGGPRSYAGRTVEDRTIGDEGREVDVDTIALALRIYRTACGLNIAVVVMLAVLIARWS